MVLFRLTPFAKHGLAALSGAALGSALDKANLNPFNHKKVHNSWTTNASPSVKWDKNWDHRDPTSLVKPSNGTPEDDNRYNKEIEGATPQRVRHIILIRHGQYHLAGEKDKDRVLTELGRRQAAMTGKRLKELGYTWDCVIKSTMTRAKETAKIICEELPAQNILSQKECFLLEEGAPAVPEPPVGHWKPEPFFYQEGARIEAAFRKHIHRAPSSQTKDSYTLIVCHANVIRYIICRALQFPPEAWLRISLNHASISWITVNPDGRVILRSIGDTGHMEPRFITSR